ncbi:MAG TPA: aminoacyl-tRNA hydrolase [Candidatus Binatia bacterium]|nr:aminoacyl-tRNA hydrolase [Candidatus Binatia bacterium]
MWVVVGLGNPGRRYAAARHNVGFRVVDRLADRWQLGVLREAHHALVGDVRRAGERVLLVKPQTYMNHSGNAVASLQRFYRVEPTHMVVVHDDVDLDVGRVRLRTGGRPGGNHGVESIIAALGETNFARVKVGVGRPLAGPVPANWVLSAPPAAEAPLLAAGEERAADAVELLLAEGPDRAMNRINQREAPHGGSPL